MDSAHASFTARGRNGLRVAQAVTSVALMGSAGHVLSIFAGFWPPGLAVFTSVMVLLTSVLYLVAPRIQSPALHGSLPGLLDIIFSGSWAVLALTAGSGFAAVDMCSAAWAGFYIFDYFYAYANPSGLCAAYGLSIALAFLLFLLTSASTVLAGLDLRAGVGLMSPGGRAQRTHMPDHWGGIMMAPAGKLPASVPAAGPVISVQTDHL